MKQALIIFFIFFSNFLLAQNSNNNWCSYDNKYALIIMGGNQASNSQQYGWYWNDSYRMYRRLINNFSFSPSNIRFLSYGDSSNVYTDEVYDLSTITNVTNAYQWMAQSSTDQDLCYIFWVDHGNPTEFLLNDGNLSHSTIGDLTKLIDARCVAGVYNPCNSGAIVDDISAMNIITITSVLPTQLNNFGWAGAWTTGITGGGISDPSDLNLDGNVSFTEIFEWISVKAIAYNEYCTYDDNGNGIYSLYNSSTYDTSSIGADGYFGKDYSLSGWNCSISNIDNAAKSISISPNPTHGQFTIHIKGHQGPIDVEVYDLSGRLLQSTNSTTISLKDYPNGIYSFRVSYGERVKEIKVVKE